MGAIHRIALFAIITWSFCVQELCAQNLVPNPNFEDFTMCPTNFSQLNFAPPWQSPTAATPDYFNACATSVDVDIPYNFPGFQPAFNGNGYAGCYFRNQDNYREYLQVQLTAPLEEGICYQVGFFMNLGNECCGLNQLGIHMGVTAPNSMNFLPLNVFPQIRGSGGYYSDTLGWTQVFGYYVAGGGEQYMTFGNFSDDVESPYDPACTIQPPYAYYYFDSVYVVAVGIGEELPIDFGDPVEACEEFLIDPDLGFIHYLWEDGSSLPTLYVTESGTYSLTISDGCAVGSDSIEVTILGNDPVMFDPEEITFCEGESITISVDPVAGEYEWNDGSHETDYVISSSGIYTVTLDDGCDMTTDEIEVTVIPLLEPIDLGPDTILCPNHQFTVALDPGLGQFSWQNGSMQSFFTITMPGSYEVTVSNGCNEVSDEIEVDALNVPEFDLGPDIIYWCTGDIIEYTFDPSLGDFLWNDGTTGPSFEIFEPGLYALTVTNACGEAYDFVDVQQPLMPLLFLTDTVVLCNADFPYAIMPQSNAPGNTYLWSTGATTNQLIVNTAGTYGLTISNACFSVMDELVIAIDNTPPVLPWDDSTYICQADTLLLDATVPNATYVWQDGSGSATLAVTAPGMYAVTISTNCHTFSDSIIVLEALSGIIVGLGPDIALCPGEQVILYAGIDSVSYVWSDMSVADSLIITSPGMYAVTVSDACTSRADTILVTVNSNPPQVDLPPSMTLCIGQSIVLESNVTGVNYLWNDGSLGSTLTINAPGTYSITVNNSCGADSDSTVIVDGGPAPGVSLGNDTSLCFGATLLIMPSFTDVDVWLWQDGSASNTFLANAPGTFVVEVSNTCGSDTDTMIISPIQPISPFSLGKDTSLCPGEILTLTLTVNDVSIEWSDGSMQDELNIITGGMYYATLANACGAVTDTIVVTQLPQIPPLNLGPDQALCPGELYIIDPGITNVEYVWQDGSTSPVFSTTQPGTFSLTITNECGVESDTLVIEESTAGPQVDLGNDRFGCVGDTIHIASGISGVSYLWQDGSTASQYDATMSGQIILQVFNNCGTDGDTLYIDLSGVPPTTVFGNDTTLCEGNTLLLTSNAPPNTSLTWQDGSVNNTFIVNAPGIYTLHEVNSCGENDTDIAISFIAAPATFTLGPDTVLCPGQFITLTAPVTTDAWQWQDGSSTTVFIADQSQSYSLTVSNVCGTAFDELQLTYIEETLAFAFDTLLICPGDIVALDATQPFPATYIWSTGAGTPVIQVQTPGEYSVSVFTACNTSDGLVHVIADDTCKPMTQFYIPNVFSPNSDGINDWFEVYFNEEANVTGVYGAIYDRWGNVVFASSAQTFRWDGRFAGEFVNPGVYVYRFILVYETSNGPRTETLTGDLTLMR